MEINAKQLYDALNLPPEQYTYIAIPARVRKILRHRCRHNGKEYTLYAHTAKNGKDEILVLQYGRFDGLVCSRYAGMYTTRRKNREFDWLSLARCIADAFPETAVRHHRQPAAESR